MNVFIFILLAFTGVMSLSENEEWIQFKVNHSKSYQNHVEEQKRFAIFQENLRKISNHNEKYNKGESTFKMGINQFADLTEQEFQDMLGISKKSKPVRMGNTHSLSHIKDLPAKVDWREKGAVTEVKNQGACGSCWSFSTTGTVEGVNFVQTGKLISLSEQNLLDCVTDRCAGCAGGYMDAALEYIRDNGGIMSEEDYPYQAEYNGCRFISSKAAVKISNFTYVKQNDEIDLQNAVYAKGPISLLIDASDNFRFYAEGVLDDPFCGSTFEEMNHGVVAVGYGTTDDGIDYWIVKNSWGPSWGTDGYLWMMRNKDNQCGVATQATYPII